MCGVTCGGGQNKVQHGFGTQIWVLWKSSQVSLIELPPPAIAFSLPAPLNARPLVLD